MAKKASKKVAKKVSKKASGKQTNTAKKVARRAALEKVAAKMAAPKRAAARTAAPQLRIHSVVHQVGDIERASSGYSQLLADSGRRLQHGGGRHYFDIGDAILSLLDVSQGGGAPQPGGSDLHLSVPSLAAYHERATELGWLSGDDVHGSPAAEMVVRPWGEHSFYVEDPWGNGICFVEAGTEHTGKE